MAAPPAKVASTRASVARRTQSYPPNHPRVVEAKRDHAEAKLTAYIEKILDAAPPLSDEQRTRLAELLRPARQAATDRSAAIGRALADLDCGA